MLEGKLPDLNRMRAVNDLGNEIKRSIWSFRSFMSVYSFLLWLSPSLLKKCVFGKMDSVIDEAVSGLSLGEIWFEQIKFLPLLNWTVWDPQSHLPYSLAGVKWRPSYNWQLRTLDSIIKPLLQNSSAQELLKESKHLEHWGTNGPVPPVLKRSALHHRSAVPG